MIISLIANILDNEWKTNCKTIQKEIEKLTNSEHDRKWLLEYAKGSFLIHHPEVQDFEVLEHYYIPEKHANIYSIEEAIFDGENFIYGFLIDDNGLARFGVFLKSNFLQYLCNESMTVPRIVQDVLDELEIPDASQIPLVYQPDPK